MRSLCSSLLLLSWHTISVGAQCSGSQARVDLNVRFFANPETAVFGIKDWSKKTSVNDLRISFNDPSKYQQYSTLQDTYCVAKNVLHEVYVDSVSTDGQADGKATVLVNGQSLYNDLPINSRYQSGLIHSDGSSCPSGTTKWRLVINFGDFPSEITWILRKNGSQILSSADTYEVDANSYSFIFYRAPFVVDKCLPDGNYDFVIESKGGDGMYSSAAPGSYSLFVGNTNVMTRSGNFGSRNSHSFPIPLATASGNLCFSGETVVMEKTKGKVRMKNLRLGDEVLAGNGQYEPIYSFGHYHKSMAGDFIQLFPSGLEITKDHLLFMESGRAVPASAVNVGDRLSNGEEISSIRTIRRIGVFAPFTSSGTLVVNGVVASNYIAFQESATLKIFNRPTFLSYHWLSHTVVMPRRIWCQSMGDCSDEEYTEDGIARWAEALYRWAVLLLKEKKTTAVTSSPSTFTLIFGLICGVIGFMVCTASRLRCRNKCSRPVLFACWKATTGSV